MRKIISKLWLELCRNGIMFTGDRGRIFVNRGTLQGKPVEDLLSDLDDDFLAAADPRLRQLLGLAYPWPSTPPMCG